MSYESVNKIKSLQQGIEAVTGNNYSDLTAAVQDLKNGYGGEGDYNEGYEAGKLDGYSEGYTASQNARQEKSITQNGEYIPDEGYSGFSKVTVNVPQKEEQEKTVNITQNGTKEVTADSGKTLSKVTITTNVSGGGGGYNPLKAFAEGTKTEITAEDLAGVEEITGSAFRGWTGFRRLTIPDSVKVIGNSAFDMCTIELLDLGNGVEFIDSYAFREGLSDSGHSQVTLRIPKNVKRIEEGAFSYLPYSTTVIFEGTPEYISETAFDYAGIGVTIKVPWSEGEVANAPWGTDEFDFAISVIYNYTE
jgi:hypothetical protein